MPEPLGLIVLAAIAAIAVPVGFIALAALVAWRRRSTGRVSPAQASSLAVGAGLALGALLLLGADDVSTAVPLLGAAAALGLNEWRSGRTPNAGWLLAGLALPWTVLWGLDLDIAAKVGAADLATALRFGVGALPLALGLVVAASTDMSPPPAASPAAPPDLQPSAPPPVPLTGPAVKPAPGRSFLVVGQAIRTASWLGPIPLPELAAVAALALVDLVGGLLTAGQPALLRVAILGVLGASAASEAYLGAMSRATRRSMEALGWLGDAERREIRAATGGGVPTTAFGARRWLAAHPPTLDESETISGLRVQLLLLAGRPTQAAALADAMVADDPPADASVAHERLSLRELVGWWLGERSRVPELRAAADAIQPADSESRLRAEVGTAIAEVRRRAVESAGSDPDNVLAPLVEARDAIDARADGLLRRTLWRPVFALFLVASLAFGLVGLVTGTLGP